ncbi:DsbC/DsbD-like thiol-disulfide interchange protein [Pararhizobium capsulatum DSM 1112]|uniref:DsbC/DsbD-like thiol-disulfide interchange protein n=1 Tax=Pararhizobium capsulatum DSM 1112 TaxID=1121113 RepID=A0ABU0BMH8_9HYPH|nr:protein-disulfide reductase DsbD domain-containing protein [Pararhizobium capsulatum]MDQ0319451.1 DsbC/DsbD-like thiol-disulfide interchange protein [Pararhizobium capsulatum DSM 1112]
MKRSGLLQNVTHFLVLATLAGYFFAKPSEAASSEWTVVEGGEVRIVAAKPQADGNIPAILDIRLKPGWKTYWREPGASGIPPEVTIDAAGGIDFSGIRFPPPQTFDDGIVRYVGYDHSVALPLTLKRNRPGDLALDASVFLGICKDICIPVQAALKVSLPERLVENPLERARIDAAVAALPAQPDDSFKVASAAYDPKVATLSMDVGLPEGADPSSAEIFVAGPPGFGFGKTAISITDGGTILAKVPVKPPTSGGALKSGSVLVVVTSGDRSIETALAFD